MNTKVCPNAFKQISLQLMCFYIAIFPTVTLSLNSNISVTVSLCSNNFYCVST